MTGARGAAAPHVLRIGDFLSCWRSYLQVTVEGRGPAPARKAFDEGQW